jgi:phosphoadenosine phosphosulfate reductase
MSLAKQQTHSDAEEAALAILRRGLRKAAGPVKLACSFSLEDVAVIDLAQQAALPLGIFAIDTGRLPEETYITAETIRQRYQVEIDWYFPQADAVQELERSKGLFSFRESLANRHECCNIRKVEPLQRALAGLSGWVTGLRREQSVTRDELSAIEVDRAHGDIVKINPLLDWSSEQLWTYAREHRIPIHPLHKQGYPSIGCAPCTRAIKEGEDLRAGRWWWEDPDHKECGLHK